MYKIERNSIIENVKRMLLESVKTLDKEVIDAFQSSRDKEENPLAKSILQGKDIPQ